MVPGQPPQPYGQQRSVPEAGTQGGGLPSRWHGKKTAAPEQGTATTHWSGGRDPGLPLGYFLFLLPSPSITVKVKETFCQSMA